MLCVLSFCVGGVDEWVCGGVKMLLWFYIIVECVSTWLVGDVCEVGKSVLIIVEHNSVRM